MAGVGRPKGVPTKPKRALIALLNERWPGWHPVLQMADIANDETVALPERFSAAKEVAKYVVPQLKAVDISQDSDKPFRLVVQWTSE